MDSLLDSGGGGGGAIDLLDTPEEAFTELSTADPTGKTKEVPRVGDHVGTGETTGNGTNLVP